MEYENSLNFLLYSYFKITLESDEEAIIEAAIDKAYYDATNQGAFNSGIAKNDVKSRNQANKAYQSVKDDILILFAENVFLKDKNWQKNWHESLCRAICEKYNNMNPKIKCKNRENAFTIGNAQKWVNMTLKNLYVIALVFQINEKNNNFTSSIISNAPEFQVPIDSYILQKLKNEGVNGVTGSGETYYYKGKAWSALDEYSEYTELQSAIKEIAEQENMTPIAWEGPAWIEVAEKRKSKSGK